jgi:formate dehydrogenase subunit gamma
MERSLYLLRILVAAVLIGLAGTASAQQPAGGSNPTEMSVREDQLLQELNRLQGRISIPDRQLAVLEQPQGRDYRRFREGLLPWIGGIAILGMTGLIAAFFLYRGRVRMRPDEHTGRMVLRFNAFERFVHWMTATSFIVLAITGLNYIFGKRLLMPLLGPDAFAFWSQGAKYAHNFIAWPFMLGVLFMIVVWIRDNLPDRYDLPWLKAGGGIVGDADPDAGRFNAGQKLVFWSVVVFGLALSASGLIMLFPFAVVDIGGMQIAQYVHATVAMIMIAIIIAHIYIGTLGMEGAFDAMWSGEVDRGWAKRHHRAWIEGRDGSSTRPRPQPGPSASAPAE